LLLGHHADGTIIVLHNTGALGDFLEWFGLNTLLSRSEQLRAGQASISEVAGEMLKDPINKVVGGLRPDLKAAFELPAGKSSYPDVFRPRSINRDEYVAGIAGLNDEYMGIRGRVLHDGSRFRPHYWTRLIGVSDPRKNALYEMYDLRDHFLNKVGEQKDFRGDENFKRMREAAANSDPAAFDEARHNFMASGKTYKNFRASLAGLDPIASKLNKADEERFEKEYLTGPQKKKFDLAKQYAADLQVSMLHMFELSIANASPEEQEVYKQQFEAEAAAHAGHAAETYPLAVSPKEKREGLTIKEKQAEWRAKVGKSASWLKDHNISPDVAVKLHGKYHKGSSESKARIRARLAGKMPGK
jgi:hypothetical protein